MSTYDPRSIRPREDWAVILMEERKQLLSSGILIAPNETGAEKVTEGAGHIVRITYGKKAKAMKLEAGQRVCLRSYFKYANPIPNEEIWSDGRPCEYFLMSVDDIMAVIPEGVDVGVYSRPSQSAVDSVSEEGTVRMR